MSRINFANLSIVRNITMLSILNAIGANKYSLATYRYGISSICLYVALFTAPAQGIFYNCQDELHQIIISYVMST